MGFMRCLILVVAATVVACGYSPPAGTGTDTPKYQSDRDACNASVTAAVSKQSAKRAIPWLISPVTRWSRIEEGMNACMAAKGWGHARACTADELRAGNRNGGLLVTRTGVQCSDPNKPS
jgi:hypothetical protein